MAKPITIERALQTEGWMEEDELKWLAEQAQLHTNIVELGSYLGRSTIALAENTDGSVIAIEDWYGPRVMDFSQKERDTLY